MLRRRVNGVAFTLLVTALPIAAHASEVRLNQSGSWQYSESRDAISNAIVRSAQVGTISIRRNERPEITAATVIVGCAEARPFMVFDWDVKVAAKAGLVVQYRFEGISGRKVKAKYVRRTRQTATNAADVRQFLSDAANSDRLYLRVLSDQYGAVEAWFSTRGGAELAAVFGGFCPSVAVD